MRLLAGLTAVVAAVLVHSCSLTGAVPEPASPLTLSPLYGTDPAGLELQVSGRRLAVVFNDIQPGGSFCRLTSPEGAVIAASSPQEAGGLLTAAFATADGLEIGVVPYSSVFPTELTLRFELASPGRTVSTPPIGSVNRVRDLTVSSFDAEQVILEWTEVNTGDYDFNGEVNVADLAPIALHYQESYTPDPDRPQTQTLYWIDGDKNGEINIGDVTVIGINFGHEIAGYNILRNGVALNEPESAELLLVPRAGAERRPPPVALPPLYHAVVPGSTGDSWSVVPVDALGNQGSISAGTITGPDFDAKASVVISGVNLWRFPGTGSSAFDGGFSMLRVILPIDDVDFEEIGEHLSGPDGVAVFAGLPRNTLLFLEIAYAPKTDLLTGEPVSQEDATANPLRTRMPFTLPDVEGQVEFAPELEVSSTELGISIDLFAQLVTGQGTEVLRSRLVLPDGVVSTDTDGDASYIDQAFLADVNLDSVSDQRINRLLDEHAYEGGTSGTTLHRGKVKHFDEAAGYLVLSEAMFWDEQFGWTPVPLPGEIAYNFTELAEFSEPGQPYIDPSTIALGEMLEVEGFFYSNLVEGLPLKFWADRIRRAE